ncbi:MAG: SDR family NAD(P)-dependent oxidoreductase [Candidatus Lokiarchaeota archaeon]|nr:SDR family NAD(P)-dependent oxidoreductase [Candidatus Lokiarchaeota archaeon]
MLKGKNVLVTGAAGFIGSNLVDALLADGAKVIGIDNMFNGRMENLAAAAASPGFTFVKGDVRDMDFLLDVMKGIDLVYHEAAFTSVPQSVKMPQLCNDVNVGGMINILNAARIRDVKRVVFASSSAVYGDTPTLPKHEEMPLHPISPYGVSKLAAEAYCIAYHQTYGLETVALRYFNVFGPRQKDSPYSGVIAIFLSKIMNNENPTIFGDGKQSRDFTYVKDVVRANMLAGVSAKAVGKAINVASGKPITMNDLTRIMFKVCKKDKLKILYTEKRTGDILHSYGDIKLAKEALDFVPQYDAVTGFEDLVKTTQLLANSSLDERERASMVLVEKNVACVFRKLPGISLFLPHFQAHEGSCRGFCAA